MSYWKCIRMQGATVVGFTSRGCMAEVHRFEYLGIVDGHERTKHAGLAVRVKVIKRGEHGIDSRDEDLGHEIEPVENGCLQEMASGLWVIVR